jgi:RNA polymerase sigma-70 factor (ECF subfamily)
LTPIRRSDPIPGDMESSDAEIIAAIRAGDTGRFEEIIRRYQARLFATVRRYSRHEDEVADTVQQILIRVFQNLDSWRGDAPFEHWLMRVAVRICYDVLRSHQRNREHPMTHLSEEESDWLETHAAAPDETGTDSDAARTLVQHALAQLPPAARLVLTLLEIEDRSVREIASLTGWSIPLVKVRAFRARAEMRRVLARMGVEKYL